MAAGADHSCLPRELAELVTGHLSPSALNSLFRASRTFGLQPTDHLVTRLYLDVAQIDLRRPHQPRRFDRLANVKTLQLLSSAEDPVADTTCSQLSSTVLFLTLHAPSMRHLTHLRLTNLPLSFVVAAAACLGAVAPAALASIHLDLTTDDSEAPAFGLSQLWPSLARVASLRSLRVGAMHTQLFSGDLDGLGRVCQLQSLQIDNAIMSVSSLPFMQGLTQLRLAGIVALGSAFQGLPACLTLSLLDIELWNFDGDDNLEAVTDCIDWSTLTGLTNLKLSLNSFDPHDLPPLPPAVLLNTALVCLTAHSAALTCAHLLHLPCLTELHCYSLELPAAGAGVRVTHLLSLDMVHCFQGLSNWGEEHTPVQAVAFTFPQLLSLSLNPSEEYGCAPASQMWPPGGLLLLPAELAAATVVVDSLCMDVVEAADAMPLLALLPALRRFGPRLLKVVLRACDGGGVDDASLCTLVGCWPRLREITLLGSAVTSTGLANLSHAPCLRSVTLLECPAVTASGIAALASCWSVERLSVSGCPLVSLGEMRDILLMVGRPQLVNDFPGL